MAEIIDFADLLAAPNGAPTGVFVDIGDQVEVLASEGDKSQVKVLRDGEPKGWISTAVIKDAAVSLPEVTAEEFAKQAWRCAFDYGVNAHYLAAAAFLRSGLKNVIVGGDTGPYRFLASEWDFLVALFDADHTLDGSFRAGALRDWRKQVMVFAAQAAKVEKALTAALARAPTVVEIYLAQLIGPQAAALAVGTLKSRFDDLKATGKITALDPLAGGQSFEDLLTRYASLLRNAPKSEGAMATVGQEKPVVGKLARNLRNKNPGNVRAATWLDASRGVIDHDTDKFCIFKTYGDGYRALNELLDRYITDFHATSLVEIIKHYAPGSDGNDENRYLQLFESAGFNRNAVLPTDPDTRAKLCRVFTQMEGSLTPFSETEIKAFILAGRPDAPAAAAGSIGAAIALLTKQLSDAVDATRDAIEAAAVGFVDAGEGTEEGVKAADQVVVPPPGSNQSFESFFNQQFVEPIGFEGREFLFRGANDASNHLNTDPPSQLWQNIIPTVRVLVELKRQWKEATGKDLRVTLLSIYRSPAYNRTLNGAAQNSQHTQFSAVDFRCDQGGPKDWFAILDKMRNGPKPFFIGGLHAYLGNAGNFVHVDTRGGKNANW